MHFIESLIRLGKRKSISIDLKGSAEEVKKPMYCITIINQETGEVKTACSTEPALLTHAIPIIEKVDVKTFYVTPEERKVNAISIRVIPE